MNKEVVFRGERYARSRAEREEGDLSLKAAIDKLFEDLQLNEQEEKELRKKFSDSIKTAVKNIRQEEKRGLTPDEKTDILNRALFTLSEGITINRRTRELAENKLIPELLQREHLDESYEKATAWLTSTEVGLREEPQERRLVVVQIDLDDIKTVNDEFGHDAGDRILREFGLGIHGSIRPEDDVFHISGDEFAALMKFSFPKGSSEEEMRAQIESAIGRVAKRAEEQVKRPDDEDQHASIGYITLSTESATYDKDITLALADDAVYVSKILGVASLVEGGGEQKAGSDRVINAAYMDDEIERYPKKDQTLFKGLRRAKRTVQEISRVTGKSFTEVMQAHYKFLKDVLES